jgi:hypothetical protein
MVKMHVPLGKGKDDVFSVEPQLYFLVKVALGHPVFEVVHPASTPQRHTAIRKVQYIYNRPGRCFHPRVLNHDGFQYLFGP